MGRVFFDGVDRVAKVNGGARSGAHHEADGATAQEKIAGERNDDEKRRRVCERVRESERVCGGV